MISNLHYKEKYLKYKNKYLAFKKKGGTNYTESRDDNNKDERHDLDESYEIDYDFVAIPDRSSRVYAPREDSLFMTNINSIKIVKNSPMIVEQKKAFIYLLSGKLIVPDTNYIKCKIFNTFDGDETYDYDNEFIKLSEGKRREFIELVFDSNEYRYHICPNNKIIFYNYKLFNKFINAFKYYYRPSINSVKFETYLLNLPCVWTHNRPLKDKIFISLLFGEVDTCMENSGNPDYINIEELEGTPIYIPYKKFLEDANFI
jgi:hypothetical protein